MILKLILSVAVIWQERKEELLFHNAREVEKRRIGRRQANYVKMCRKI